MRNVRAKLLRKQALAIASTSQLTAILGGTVRKSNQAKWEGFRRIYRDLKKAWNVRGGQTNEPKNN